MSQVPSPPRLLRALAFFLWAAAFLTQWWETPARAQGPEVAREDAATTPGGTPVPQPPPPVVVDGQAVADELQRRVAALDRADRLDDIEPLVEATVRRYSDHWEVLFQGARIYAELERAGYWVEGRYRRGDLHGNPPAGARRVYSHRRDHLRALQFLDRAIRLTVAARGAGVPASPEEGLSRSGVLPQRADLAAFYWEAAQILTGEKAFLRLYERTDLSRLPTLEYREPAVVSREPVPVDDEGNPQFFDLPASWEAAENDGERLLWLLEQARRLDPDYEAEAEFIHAKHLLKAYLGVQTLTEDPLFDPSEGTFRPEAEEAREMVENLPSLTDSESVAVLADGIRRITLPDSQNFVLRLQRMTKERAYRSHAALALEELADAFENRRQYRRAATFWEALVRLQAGESINESPSEVSQDAPPLPSWEKERLHQIVKSWGRFEDASPVEAGDPLTLSYWYRNGKEVTFTAHRVDVTALVADLLEYLRSDPFPIDPDRISVSKLGLHLVREGGERYLKEQVADWKLALQPSEKHWDQRVEVEVPLDKPGAYLVEAEIEGGHRCSVLVWINDMTILRRPVEDGLFYYVTDKRQGEPMGWTKFTFIGYRLALVDQPDEPELDVHGEEIPEALRRQYHVLTKEITKWADAKGQLILDDDLLEPDYRWFLLANAPKERVAILGFSDLKPPESPRQRDPARPRAFLATGKTRYQAGQTCRFQGWVRATTPPKIGDETVIPQEVGVALVRAGETISELAIPIDTGSEGGFAGELQLPSHLPLGAGNYRLVVRQGDAVLGQCELVVESPDTAPVRLRVESAVSQVERGQPWEVRVRSETAGRDSRPAPGVEVVYRVLRRPHETRWERAQPHAWLYGKDYDLAAASAAWFPGWERWGWTKREVDFRKQPRGANRPSGAKAPQDSSPERRNETLVLQGRAQTAEDGILTLSLATESPSEAMSPEEDYLFEVRLAEGHEESVEPLAAARVVVSDRPFKVYAKMDKGYYRAGEKAVFRAWARDHRGRPVQGKGELILYHVHYDSAGRPLQRGWRQEMATNAEGRAQAALRIPGAGQYRASYTVTDAEGRQVEGACVLLVVDDSFAGAGCRFNTLEILPDQVVYHPGETVRLRLNTSEAGENVAVFVRARSGAAGRAEVLHFDRKSVAYESIVVSEEDAPGFVVEAILLRGGDFEVHTREILVAPPRPLLHAELAVEELSGKPGDQGTIVLRVTDEAGLPVAGEAVLRLDPPGRHFPGKQTLAQVFWDDRSAYVPAMEDGWRTRFQSFARPPEEKMRPLGIFGSLRAGTVMEEERDEEADREGSSELSGARGMLTASPEASWPEYWWPRVSVDAKGEARIPLTLPVHEGVWTLRAWVVDPLTRVAEVSLPLTVQRDWGLTLDVPAEVVEGDRFTVEAIVENRLETAMATEWEFTTSPGLEILEGPVTPASTSTWSPGERRALSWTVAANEASGSAEAWMHLRIKDDTGVEESCRENLSIRPRQEVTRQAWHGRLAEKDAELVMNLDWPEDLVATESRLTIHFPNAVGLAETLTTGLAEIGSGIDESLALASSAAMMHRLAVWVMHEQWRRRMGGERAEAAADVDWRGLWKRMEDRLWETQNDDGGWGLAPLAVEAAPGGSGLIEEEPASGQDAKDVVEGGADSDAASGGGNQRRSHPVVTASILENWVEMIAELSPVSAPGDEWPSEESDGRLRNALDFLNKHQDGRLKQLGAGSSEATAEDAYLHMVLQSYDAASVTMKNFLLRDWEELPLVGQVMLAQTLHREGAINERNGIRFSLGEKLRKDEVTGGVYLPLGAKEGLAKKEAPWVANADELQGRYLCFLAEAKGDAPVTDEVARQLSMMREGPQVWSSERSTAGAWKGLFAYLALKAEKEGEPEKIQDDQPVSLTLWAGETPLDEEGVLTSVEAKGVFALSGEDLERLLKDAGTEAAPFLSEEGTGLSLRLKASGVSAGQTGNLDVHGFWKVVRRPLIMSAQRSDVAIERRYYRSPQGEGEGEGGELGPPLTPGEAVIEGDTLEVVVTLDTGRSGAPLIITDWLPSGCELAAELPRGAVLEGRLLRIALPPSLGKQTVRYRLKAVRAGQFHALPASLTTPGEEQERARSDEMILLVRPSSEAASQG